MVYHRPSEVPCNPTFLAAEATSPCLVVADEVSRTSLNSNSSNRTRPRPNPRTKTKAKLLRKSVVEADEAPVEVVAVASKTRIRTITLLDKASTPMLRASHLGRVAVNRVDAARSVVQRMRAMALRLEVGSVPVADAVVAVAAHRLVPSKAAKLR